MEKISIFKPVKYLKTKKQQFKKRQSQSPKGYPEEKTPILYS
jgi:hypothetical protein